MRMFAAIYLVGLFLSTFAIAMDGFPRKEAFYVFGIVAYVVSLLLAMMILLISGNEKESTPCE